MFDLITIRFLLKYLTRPLHFFGRPGLMCFFGGMGMGLFLVAKKLVVGGDVFTQHAPLLMFAVLMVLAGVQLLCFGLLGEMLTRVYFESSQRTIYAVEKVIRHEDLPPSRKIPVPNRTLNIERRTSNAELNPESGNQPRTHEPHERFPIRNPKLTITKYSETHEIGFQSAIRNPQSAIVPFRRVPSGFRRVMKPRWRSWRKKTARRSWTGWTVSPNSAVSDSAMAPMEVAPSHRSHTWEPNSSRLILMNGLLPRGTRSRCIQATWKRGMSTVTRPASSTEWPQQREGTRSSRFNSSFGFLRNIIRHFRSNAER